MASRYFSNFPEITYKLDSGKLVKIKDFFRKSKIEQEAVNAIIEYDVYRLNDGERPDVAAAKLYGDQDLHWTFLLVNDIENYYDWHKDSQTFERYINKKFPGQLAIGTQSTDILTSSSKFLLGEKVTSVSSEGRIIEVSPLEKRICIEGGNFVANELITGSVSGKTFTPTSVVNQRDGVKYYKNSDGLRRNTELSGYTSVSFYDDEFELNEEKRIIKFIRPELIGSIVQRFSEVMTG
tara:strand:- start:5286 stop:5996 length:711 start_codon:yes stop_codon:yes gene_type:complete